jgi:hypothetical protein
MHSTVTQKAVAEIMKEMERRKGSGRDTSRHYQPTSKPGRERESKGRASNGERETRREREREREGERERQSERE